MYEIDQDRVIKLPDVPQSSVGAPQPLVIADEHRLLVGFYLENPDPSWDGTYVRIIDSETTAEPVGVISFASCRAMTFGPPNDEAFSGHPLAQRGLKPYGAFEVLASSWI